MLSLKEDVRVTSLSPQILLAIFIAQKVYENLGKELVVTSVCDGNHSHNSLHWIGHAVDLRTRHIPSNLWKDLSSRIAASLGDDYDVILEDDHIHIEFQPEKR